MLQRDDVEDIQEITKKILDNTYYEINEIEDERIAKNVLCSVFTSLIMTYFPEDDQVVQLFQRIAENILNERKKANG